MRQYSQARKAIGKTVFTGVEALDDTYWLLHKAVPVVLPAEEVQPSYLVNRAVAQELSVLSTTKRLRLYTVGDPVATAHACVELRPTLEGIFDRLAVEQCLANDLQDYRDRMVEIGASIAQAEFDFDDADIDDGDELERCAAFLQILRHQLEVLETQTEQTAAELDDHLEREGGSIGSDLRAVVTRAADDLEYRATAAEVWGLAPGQLVRMPAAERLALAKKLNTTRMREIADLFGRIQNLALSEAAETVTATYEEIYDLEHGNDLGRVVPAEFLMLGEDTENLFFARYADRELLQYEVRGTEPLGRGGIVMCVDGSASMDGQRERWAKAVMLVLLHLAREQKRTMHVIHFGGPGQLRHIPFTEPQHFCPERIIDAASTFFYSGTDFVTPMRAALEVLTTEFATTNYARSDVVFATDDECGVPDGFMATYLAEMDRMSARTWGIAFARYDEHGPLFRMCEGRVASIKDLTSGHDVRDMLRGTR